RPAARNLIELDCLHFNGGLLNAFRLARSARWRALRQHFDFGFNWWRRRVVRKADGYLDRLAPPVRDLFVHPKIDPAQPADGEIASRLNPELVEVPLVLAEPPAPGFVKTKEHAPAGAHELLHGQRMALLAAFALTFRKHGQDLGRTLRLVTLGVPEH